MLKVVVSAVNIVQGGILTILNDALAALKVLKTTHDLDVIVFVHSRLLVTDYLNDFNINEYPEIKLSWIKRLKFEYIDSKKISETLKPDIWIALHDITPNVTCPIQVVYCHNPSPFYKLDVKRFFYDTTFSLFCIFYKYLYKVNIKKNTFVIVQQQWIREYFKKNYGVRSIVAYPEYENHKKTAIDSISFLNIDSDIYTFIYPLVPRIFKNLEILLLACRSLDQANIKVQVIITMDGTENTYAKKLYARFKDIRCVKFIGLQSRSFIEQLYQKADCLVFPSKLETWGLPVSEFKHYQKPVIISDLPFAHETIGEYNQVKFFNPDDAKQLADYMKLAFENNLIFDKNIFVEPEEPFFKNWIDLLSYLLGGKYKEY